MVSLKWCWKIKRGLELVEPNNNMSESYLKMAEESLIAIRKFNESKVWSTSAAYYSMYYSLYSLMIRIGVKCEIHQCSLKFMRKFFHDFYNKEDMSLIEDAFELRNDLQYYPGKFIDEEKHVLICKKAVDFFVKTKNILIMLSEKEIDKIRKKVVLNE